jgi:triacylglycerol lipase
MNGKLFCIPPGFDLAIAKEAADLAKQAYDQLQHGSGWTPIGPYDLLGQFSARAKNVLEPFGFVVRNQASGNVFVSFRGTQSLQDWLENITIGHTHHPWGNVEKGFSDIYGQVSNAVKGFAPAGANVFVTGHSLGGALAVLATADLKMSGWSPVMYSFAGPRTGDLGFAASFNREVPSAWRVVNTEDLVTTVPLATGVVSETVNPFSLLGLLQHLAGGLEYEHVGIPVDFTQHNGNITDNHDVRTYIAALA